MRALMAAQSGLEVGLYRLYPMITGRATVRRPDRTPFAVRAGGLPKPRWLPADRRERGRRDPDRLQIPAAKGVVVIPNQSGANPDFAVSRTLVAEAFDGATP